MRVLVGMVLGLIACDAGALPLPPPSAPAPAPSTKVVAPVEPPAPAPVPPPVPPPPPPRPASGAKHAPAAVIVVVDRSGSMQGAKLEAAKQAARVVVETLEPSDEVGVIAFDSESRIVAPLQRDSARASIETAIGAIAAGGGTNVYPALKDAVGALRDSKLAYKHIILLTDGEAPYDGLAELLQDAVTAHITISAVGVEGADRNLLTLIADAGHGRLYVVGKLEALPEVFRSEVKEALDR